MTETVAIVVGTYGDEEKWTRLARRAMASARAQTVPSACSHVHHETLAQARNLGAELTESDWLVFLDADDELDPHYVEGILDGSGDLRQPMTLGVYPDGHEDPVAVLIPRKNSFREGNWLVVGTGIRRSIFYAAGGWGEEALYEDWACWIRCWLAGASIGSAPKAIYRVSVHDDGRNEPAPSVRVEWFERIASTYAPEAKRLGLPW